MKKIISILLILVMSITLITPSQAREAQAAETVAVSTWAIPDLINGDTYGIYPLTWYEKGLTGTINQAKFRSLLYGVRRKIVYSECVEEVRFRKPVIDNDITVKEVLEAFYTMLTNYDYTVDLGLGLGMEPVTYMQQIGVYTGQNGEQGLQELCTMEQAMVIATRIVTVVYGSLDASSKGFMWEVKAGENTVYLLGSIHLASNTIYPFSSKMWQAYYNSNALIVEANLYDQADMASLNQLMYYSDGTTLKDYVSADTYQKAVETAALIGIPEEISAYLKPWALYLTFENYTISSTSSNDEITAQLGIDMNLLTNAVIYQKPVYAIEGLAKQGAILDGFSAGLQEYLLSIYCTLVSNILDGTAVEEDIDIDQYMDTLFTYWKNGDIEGFKSLTIGDTEEAFVGELNDEIKAYSEEFYEKFLKQRDDAMADYINSLLESDGTNTFFVIVGAAHYISNYSVIDRLENMGYEVNQVK
jgi:uncharacterized protein YbaP (TraB family)